MSYNFISWIIAILALSGHLELNYQNKKGYIFLGVSQTISLVLFYRTSLWGLFFLNCCSLILSINGFRIWYKKENLQ